MELKVDSLVKSFDKKEVLKGASFTFESGKIYGLLGRNGDGKTTFFNILNSDLPADSGSFILDTGSTSGVPDPSQIGYVLSTPTVPGFLTAREFLKFYLDIHKKEIKDLKTIDEYFDMVSLNPEDRDRLLNDFSHGMKNKMQMLLYIISKPEVLLLDEPLTSLDVVVAEEMKDLLRSMKEGRILIFSTHLLDIAVDLCDEIVLLSHGVFELVSKDNLDDGDFKVKIIEALKEE